MTIGEVGESSQIDMLHTTSNGEISRIFPTSIPSSSAGPVFSQPISQILESMSGGTARRIFSGILTTLFVVALLAGATVAYLHKQQIADHFAAQRFSPSAEIIALTDSLDLTDAGRRIFLASHPTLDASQNFNAQCAGVDHDEGSHVLGCFVGGSIHLFNVTDPRVAGIVEVTAAHELLHAVFSRLSDDERTALSHELIDTFDELSANDPGLAERMAVYDGLSERGFANELHSVLGTEVRILPDNLEEHYAQWFEDRGLIVDYFDAYHAVFVELQARSAELQSIMEPLRADIETRSANYDAAVQQFNADAAEFNQQNDAFMAAPPASAEEGRAIVAQLQQRSAELQSRLAWLEAELASLQADIARYEEMRLELVQLGATNAELQEHLNSQLAPLVAP